MVTVILSNGSQRQINGRQGRIIQWLTLHDAELSQYNKFKLEIHCAGQDVVITPMPVLTERLPATDD